MPNDKELLQQALDVLETLIVYSWNDGKKGEPDKSEDYAGVKIVEAIKARLAQPEPEPVAWMYEFGTDNADAVNDVRWYKNVSLTKPHGMVRDVVSLYTTPPKKEWVGLTYEDVEKVASLTKAKMIDVIEAKLKEKNGMD